MKAAVVPSKKQSWIIQDLSIPEPQPNQVLIKIHASGVCYTDIHQTEGTFDGVFPRILGHEAVGEIVRLGNSVTSRKVGDRMGVPWVQKTCERCEWCLSNKGLFCPDQVGTSAELSGGHAEYMLAFAEATMLIPNPLSYEQAASIFCAGYTVWSGFRSADPQPNERVAILGIGGLGHLGVQYCKAAGFETVAISSSPDKYPLIKKLGADIIVKNPHELAELGGADIILCTSNANHSTEECFKALRPDGRLVVMGIDTKPLQIPTHELIFKRLKVIGSLQNNTLHLYEALQIAASGKIKVMTETYPLCEAPTVYEKVKQGKVRFRAVLIP